MKWRDTSTRNDRLEDSSPFPFGKYGPKGESPSTMSGVPCDYYMWLDQQEWLKDWPAVADYMERNWARLEQAFALTGRSAPSRGGDGQFPDYDYGDIDYD